MGGMASQITSLTIVYWTVYSGWDQRKHQSSASLTLVQGIHQWPGGVKNTFDLLDLRAFKSERLNKIRIFHCMC